MKLIFKGQCIGDSISKLYHREVTLKLVRALEKKKNQINAQQKMLQEEVLETSSSSDSEVDIDIKEARRLKKNNSNKAKMNMQSIFSLI